MRSPTTVSSVLSSPARNSTSRPSAVTRSSQASTGCLPVSRARSARLRPSSALCSGRVVRSTWTRSQRPRKTARRRASRSALRAARNAGSPYTREPARLGLGHDAAPGRHPLERVRVPHREVHRQRPARDLGPHLDALAREGLGGGQALGHVLRPVVALEERRPDHRPPARAPDLAQVVQRRLLPDGCLEEAAPGLAHRAREGQELRLVREPARHRQAVLAHVGLGGGRAEADGAGRHGLAHETAHGVHLLGGRDPVLAVAAHHPLADGRVADAAPPRSGSGCSARDGRGTAGRSRSPT